MKKNVIVMLVFVMVATFSMAQNLGNRRNGRKHLAKIENPEMAAKKMTNNMVKKLSLNATQAKDLLKLNTKFATERFNHQQKMMKLRKAQQKKMKAFVAKRDVQLKSLLTPAQYKTFQDCKMSRANKSKMGKRGNKAKRAMRNARKQCCTK